MAPSSRCQDRLLLVTCACATFVRSVFSSVPLLGRAESPCSLRSLADRRSRGPSRAAAPAGARGQNRIYFLEAVKLERLLLQYFRQKCYHSPECRSRRTCCAQQPRLSRARVPDRSRSRPCPARGSEARRALDRFVLSARKGAVSHQKALRSARAFFSRFGTESIGESFALPCTACLFLLSVYSQCFKLKSKTRCASVFLKGNFKQGVMRQLYNCSNGSLSSLVLIPDLLVWAQVTLLI